MVAIPEGEFSMGAPESGDESPPHRVRSAAFCIDAAEVTVTAYRACTAARRCTEPSPYDAHGGQHTAFCNWGRSGMETHPVNCVDWNQARSYCAWVGGRLPTEAEWEYAARGSDGRTYPWGSEAPDGTRTNLCGSECRDAARAAGHWPPRPIEGWTDPFGWTAPVGSFPAGNTPEGVQDMGGNVREWTEDGYAANAYQTRAAGFTAQRNGSEEASNRSVRGASWRDTDVAEVRAAARSMFIRPAIDDDRGFRCARGAR